MYCREKDASKSARRVGQALAVWGVGACFLQGYGIQGSGPSRRTRKTLMTEANRPNEQNKVADTTVGTLEGKEAWHDHAEGLNLGHYRLGLSFPRASLDPGKITKCRKCERWGWLGKPESTPPCCFGASGRSNMGGVGVVCIKEHEQGERERERACSCQRRLEPRVCAKGAQSDAELPHGTLFEPAQQWECGEPAQPDAEQRCHQAWGKDGEIMRGSDHSCLTMRRHGYHGRESRCWARYFVRYSNENGILLKEVAAICCFCGANCSPKPWVLVSRN